MRDISALMYAYGECVWGFHNYPMKDFRYFLFRVVRQPL